MREDWPPLRVHLTNVAGTGATRLLQSLLPAMERIAEVRIEEIHLPDRGELSTYQPVDSQTRVRTYRRHLPNAVSRLLECTLLGGQFDSSTPLLVLGDLPLRCRAPQTVFVQTPHLCASQQSLNGPGPVKYAIARRIFSKNAARVRAFIVQTPVMKAALIDTYPDIADRVHVIAQPVPSWVQAAHLVRRRRERPMSDALTLVYPAAWYPHKNHRLLRTIDPREVWPIASLAVTILPEQLQAPSLPWVRCTGPLAPSAVLELYRQADGLLFLSTDESYGFPLVEAMSVGLPIVCPDLPYARTLCGDVALYFNPWSASSLKAAIEQLNEQLRAGWWPDWTANLTSIPPDWDTVARAITRVALDSKD